ncbi:hypothetical protein [Kamptonema formosum]|uniref:hypothetical protein n=1 Tax=Kamptonema formosum TaxID=331992 RepID=UPI000348BB09|nr:hypothetical protein [Oscillatoria sp. PCC 10802]
MLKPFRQKNFFEFVALFLAGLGIFLLVEPFEIRATLGSLGAEAARAGLESLKNLRQIAASDAIAVLLLAVSAVLLVNRIRYRLQTSEQLVSLKCPACGSKLHRNHRQLFDRLINSFVPVFRYRCANRQCGWQGLRVKRLSSHKDAG